MAADGVTVEHRADDGAVRAIEATQVIEELIQLVQGKCSKPSSAAKNIDWTLRALVKRILRTSGCPPDKQKKAAWTVLEQAEGRCPPTGLPCESAPRASHGGVYPQTAV